LRHHRANVGIGRRTDPCYGRPVNVGIGRRTDPCYGRTLNVGIGRRTDPCYSSPPPTAPIIRTDAERGAGESKRQILNAMTVKPHFGGLTWQRSGKISASLLPSASIPSLSWQTPYSSRTRWSS